MSRVPMQSSGGAWFADPKVSIPTYFVPQGISADLIATKWGYGREDLDSYAVESQRRAAHAWEEGYFDGSVVPVTDPTAWWSWIATSTCARAPASRTWASSTPPFEGLAKMAGFDQVALMRYPEVERIEFRHHAGNSRASSTARPPCSSATPTLASAPG